ncbi:hypothetical protein VB834_07470 [Limnoraphis robusta Tam1]|uniref:hypothetical protein n=1 Tax=Limnoraphis robusta TaxID=1118279 RepID=UPI002B208851|nr:hypothetical protein [Limnoraphis robusta]MEA5500808.1 hypothetical protein [Limnoraphis robusta BA-68 BA1]MEA5538868.1 hypothetical protein [Limnoraphis robusta Tam1]
MPVNDLPQQVPDFKTPQKDQPPSHIKVAIPLSELPLDPQVVTLEQEADVDAWNQLLNWINESLFNLNLLAAEASVQRLKNRCPNKTTREIAQTLIFQKCLQVSGLTLIKAVPKVESMLDNLMAIQLPEIAKISAEMVYQISSLYGFTEDLVQQENEILMAFSVALLGEKAINAGLGWLKLGFVASTALSATAKVLMIRLIGDVACLYYENKRGSYEHKLENLDEVRSESQLYLETQMITESITDWLEEEIETDYELIKEYQKETTPSKIKNNSKTKLQEKPGETATKEAEVIVSEVQEATAKAKEAKVIVSEVQEATAEAKDAQEQISALVQYVENIDAAIAKKEYTEINDFILVIGKEKRVIVKAGGIPKIQNTDKFTKECLNTVKISVDVSKSVQQVVQEVWTRYWRERLLAILKDKKVFEQTKTKQIFFKLKENYPAETKRLLANRFITEKSLFATLAGLVNVVPIDGEKVKVNLLKISAFFIEMIEQIAYIYGDDVIKDGDKLTILAIVFETEIIAKLHLESLTKQGVVKIKNGQIEAGINLALFLLVGYATCEYYEYKLKKEKSILEDKEAFKELKTKVIAYSEELVVQETTLEAEVIEKAVEITKQVESIEAKISHLKRGEKELSHIKL